MAQYWVRKDEQEEELLTIKPWEEQIANGHIDFPEPKNEQKDKE